MARWEVAEPLAAYGAFVVECIIATHFSTGDQELLSPILISVSL
jgi:hypothetical protein